MLLRLVNLLAAFLLLAGLHACGELDEVTEPAVVVGFAAPFPAGGRDLPGFAHRHQVRYVAADDSTQSLLLAPTALLLQRWNKMRLPAPVLDSLGLPRRPGQYHFRGQWLRVQALAADTFLLAEQHTDTLFALRAGRLRRYRGCYYLSQPTPNPLLLWQVARLSIVGPHLSLQRLRPDSLRLRALQANSLSLRREPSRLLFTIQPQSRLATSQVHDYAGLWETQGSYEQVGSRPAGR